MSTNRPSPTIALRPEPKTSRGRDTQAEILQAARKLVSERWVHETPFTDLAAAAGVARASLLHAFPHWRDVTWSLLIEELDQLDRSHERAIALKRAKPSVRVYTMLVVLLDRAEKTGRLYPNLRSAMFTWHGEPSEEEYGHPDSVPWSSELMGRMTLIPLRDYYELIEEFLEVPDELRDSRKFPPRPTGECLVNFTLDLAAGYPSYCADFHERRELLQTTIELLAAGVRHHPGSKRKPRRRKST